MIRKNHINLYGVLLTVLLLFVHTNLWAATEIYVETAGTLQSLLTSTEQELKVTGVINGSDIKYIRQLVTVGTVKKLDWSGVRIVSGGQAYYESYTTQDDIVGEKMFYQCSSLQQMILPSTAISIKKNAFANTGLTQIDIPNSVRSVGEDAFAYCSSLTKVVIGKKVNQLSKGSFYASAVQKAYVKPIVPPSPQSYLFSSSPMIYVYASALSQYQASAWAEYGTIVGDLTDDIVDGVEEVEEFDNHENLSDATYDLMGRRVTDLRPGTIYIRNGKKFIIR